MEKWEKIEKYENIKDFINKLNEDEKRFQNIFKYDYKALINFVEKFIDD